MAGARRPGGDDSRCRACRAPVLRQFVECLGVTADPTPITPGTDNRIRGPNRLVWCLPPPRTGTTPRLRWIHPSIHPPDCPHPHHPDHECQRTEQSALF